MLGDHLHGFYFLKFTPGCPGDYNTFNRPNNPVQREIVDIIVVNDST